MLAFKAAIRLAKCPFIYRYYYKCNFLVYTDVGSRPEKRKKKNEQ